MKGYSIPVEFKAKDSRGGRSSIDVRLELSDETGLPEEELIKESRTLLDAVEIDLSSSDNEIHGMYYAGSDGRGKLSIYGPGEGYVRDAVLRDGAVGVRSSGSIKLDGHTHNTFYSDTTDYSVMLGE